MKCPNCGKELKAGQLYCENCGYEIQIVPDYDPLDELLIGQDEPPEKPEPAKEPDSREAKRNRPREEVPETGGAEKKTGRFRKRWLLYSGGLLLCFAVFMFSYLFTTRDNNYSYQLRRGRALTEDGKYEEAIPYLERAQVLQAGMEGADTEPLEYLALAYAHTGENALAAATMESAIEMEEAARGDNYRLSELYQAYMEVLNQTGQTEQISRVIEECSYPDIRKELLPYRIEKPACSVQEGTYSYYLRLELSAEYGTIYYTLDGSMPTAESTPYEKPIELRDEGETLLSAVAVNEMGMVSDPLVLVYKLEFQEDD